MSAFSHQYILQHMHTHIIVFFLFWLIITIQHKQCVIDSLFSTYEHFLSTHVQTVYINFCICNCPSFSTWLTSVFSEYSLPITSYAGPLNITSPGWEITGAESYRAVLMVVVIESNPCEWRVLFGWRRDADRRCMWILYFDASTTKLCNVWLNPSRVWSWEKSFSGVRCSEVCGFHSLCFVY